MSLRRSSISIMNKNLFNRNTPQMQIQLQNGNGRKAFHFVLLYIYT